ncbi:MAG: Ig-like domain-containing protein, partial [Rhodocyclaceae bacterium]|nr:Ig-like domain-containing protein [Rhodocyclaceae bacterium]
MASITLSNSVSLIENTNQDFNLYSVLSQAGLNAPPPIGTLVIQIRNANGTYSTAPAGTYSALDLDSGAGKETLHVAMTSLPTFIGEQDLKLIITDGAQPKDTITLFLAVHVLPVPPTAHPDSNTVIEDTIATGNVLSNDSDSNGQPLAVTQFHVNGATYTAGTAAAMSGIGSLTINVDGSYTFAPASHYYGPMPQASYTVSDGLATATSTLDINVTPLPPTANADSQVTMQGTPATGNVLGNDTDINNLPLTVTGFSVAGQAHAAGETATLAGIGTLTIAANGSYTFTPDAAYSGSVPTASYTISDGQGTSTADLTLTVVPFVPDNVNSAPVAQPDTAITQENQPISGNVLTNDSDVDGDALSVTQFVVGGTTYAAGSTAVIAGVGSLTIAANGDYSFTPATNYYGPGPQATYTVTDGQATDTSTLTVGIFPVGPTAVADAQTLSENTTASGNVLTNDVEINGQPKTVTEFSVAGQSQTYNAGDTAVIANVGNLTLNGDGSYSFVPATNYYGTVPQVSYTMSDGLGTSSSTLDITVTPVGPTAVADSQTAVENTGALTGTVLANDTDVNGLPLTVTQFVVNGGTYSAGQTATLANVGTLVIAANGAYSFTPVANYYGHPPVATYTISDGNGSSDATLSLNVTPVGPVAVADSQTAIENTGPLTGTVLANDTDVNGLPLSVTQFVVNGSTYSAGQTATLANVGTLVINSDGSYSFTPVANYYGHPPVATYTISDGNGSSDATLSLNVTPVGPVAVADSQTAIENTGPLTGTVLSNDTDVNGLPLSVTQFVVKGGTYSAGQTATLANVGTLVINSDGSYSFTPVANYYGHPPVATYTISDGNGSSDATLSLNVTPVGP